MPPSGLNDSNRSVMGAIKRFWRRINGTVTSTGSSNSYAISYGVAPLSYGAGERFCFVANHSNDGPSEANVNSLGAVDIKRLDGSDLEEGDILEDQMVEIVHDGTVFQLMNRSIAATVSTIETTIAARVPAGSIQGWLTDTPPTGWLECDGSAISRTTYANLFAVLGVTYGAGNGTTTFNIPDFRGEFLRGWSHGSTNDPDRLLRSDRGDGTNGNNVGTKQAAGMQDHTHEIHVNSDGPGTFGDFIIASSARINQQTASAFASITTHGVNSPVATSANETHPRNVYVMWIIRT
jgi:microcystin-dependent protein